MKTRIFLPPIKPTGGTAVLLRIAEILARAGQDAALVLREPGASGPMPGGAPVLAWNELRLAPGDLWLAPEGWVNALTPGLTAKARSMLYVQNWAYLFASLPPGVHWGQLDVEFLSVSQPVAWFVRQTLGKEGPVLRPGIDLGTFFAPEAKPAGPLRVAWMPRKNKALAAQIRDIAASRRRLAGKPELLWREVHGLDRAGVAQALRESHIFLVTGFPEGCPLPPLEAMACGCLCVGFSGFGGWDYMRQAQNRGFRPWWPLRPREETPWSGNGLWVADADVMAAALALEQAADWIESRDPALAPALENARLTANCYAQERQEEAVLDLWRRLANGEPFG